MSEYLEVKSEHVKRLWDFASRWPHYSAMYFSHVVGDGLVHAIGLLGLLSGKVLDYGCGTGELIGRLLRPGVVVSGVDSSAESIDVVNMKYGKHRQFGTAMVVQEAADMLASETFDLVLSIETIEHLFPQEIAPIFDGVYTATKPGGYVIVTTPYNEDLQKAMCFCPNCGKIYHKWLHLSSFQKISLATIMEARGFETVLCENTDFLRFQRRSGKRHWARQFIRNPALSVFDHVFSRSGTRSLRLRADLGRGHNLMYVGRKPA